MVQFTQQEILQFREKVKRQPQVLRRLREETAEVFENPLLVPKEGIANWKHYYYCPDCSVELIFNREDNKRHRCPQCGKICTGEPYDSTWWGYVNVRNYVAAQKMGLVYLLTGERAYAEKARDLMLEYAKYYKGYAVHGNIPYNGPGKAEAQTLNESIFIRTYCYTYDLIADMLTEAQRETILHELLEPGAEFLVQNRHDQLHNHEVICDSAIAVCGILLGREDLLRFAIHEKYGLLYQLEQAVLADKMWFECSVGYHFFALKSFFEFEKFAVHTPYSQIRHPNYQAMLEMVSNLLQPDYRFPSINDSGLAKGSLSYMNKEYSLFEFGYKMTGSERLLQILHKIYEDEPRDSYDAFFYGVDELPDAPPLELEEYHDEQGSGFTVLRGDEGRYLLLKNGPYGGEHDHYDRLGLSYLHAGEPVSQDLGTCGYGAFYHYEYYKNTGTHNTVMIGEENMAPANARTLEFKKDAQAVTIDAVVDWNAPFTPPDSFTIVQWDEASYRHVRYRRKLKWCGRYLIDVFYVDGVEDNRTIDWVMHFGGERLTRFAGEEPVERFSEKKPFKYLKNVSRLGPAGQVLSTFAVGKVKANLHSLVEQGELYFAQGPDNPSYKDISYVIHRVRGEKAVFVNLLESYTDAPYVQKVTSWLDGYGAHLTVQTADGVEEFKIKLMDF